MRKQLVSLALSTFFGLGVAMASPQAAATPQPQDQPAAPSQANQHKPDPNRQLQMLTKRLNLTSDQQNQILPILTDRAQQFESIRNDSSLAPKERHEKLSAVRQDTETKIRALLNDQQKQTYDQMLEKMRERAREHREQHQ